MNKDYTKMEYRITIGGMTVFSNDLPIWMPQDNAYWIKYCLSGANQEINDLQFTYDYIAMKKEN